MSHDDKRRAIGKVVTVSADRFVIEMHAGTDNFTVVGFDDVHYVARLGSFVIIPIHTEYVVAEIVGLRDKDVGAAKLKDDPSSSSSAKFLDVVPVGMLPHNKRDKFRFGVSVYPSLYADALYVLDTELDRVFETDLQAELAPSDGSSPDPAGATRYRALPIGRSVVFEGYDVKVKIDEFFGGHSAVLGNTGSGKSCTVASILQSLFAKPDEHFARGATFIVLDVNGEYGRALVGLSSAGGISVKRIELDGSAALGRLTIPHWLLEMSEWELLLQASEKTQIPVLRTALGLTSLLSESDEKQKIIQRHFVATCIVECFRGSDGDSPVSKIQRVSALLEKYGTPELNRSILQKYGCNEKYGNFDPPSNQGKMLSEIKQYIETDVKLPSYKCKPFSFDDLETCLDFAILYEEAHGNRQIRDYCAQMLTRFKSLRDRKEYEFLRSPLPKAGKAEAVGKTKFLEVLLGLSEIGNGRWRKEHQIIILDMNSVDDEVVELVSAVLARLVFQLLRQSEPRNRFPVHLLLEEAHRYIASTPSRYAVDASKIFERIAKEGRKYGVFLLAASQRPSELSKTVLSQCSNFVIHRIQNPDDLLHIRQMTPFISSGVLERLPSLPKQHALVFGTAVALPTTFRVRNANPLPASDDARIRDLWFIGHNKELSLKLT